jgi:transcriptional regulator with GAF, ATPase, and Fis domain
MSSAKRSGHQISDELTTAADDRLALSPSPLASFRVTLESGPTPHGSIEIRGSEPGEVIVGQSPVCALRLADPMVSRRHLALDVVGDRLRVRDLGSKNGTSIGALRVLVAFASPGDAITIGRSTLRVAVAGPADASLPATDRYGDVLGFSREMRRLFPLLERLAASNIPILIEGETGTGKEAVAQALHARGPRAARPFVLFDCTAITQNLLESELFGHEKGAFTGATAQRKGVFEEAHGGTLFIDELGDLPLDLQAKLLRALDTGQVRRVGGNRWIQCDVRVICATRRDVEHMVQDNRFRDDLYHRLAVGRVALPPLRDRRGDVPLLVEHFCREFGISPSTLSRELLDRWRGAPWPGNVRELRNAVARTIALGELAQAPTHIEKQASTADASPGRAFEELLEQLLPYDDARPRALEIFQRAYIDRVMQAANGSVQRGAEISGLALRYFQLLRARHRAR